MKIRELMSELDSRRKELSEKDLLELVSSLEASPDGILRPKFSRDDGYQRVLVRSGSCYEILVLGWLPGQASPVHNHKGSSCAVRVLSGNALEERFSMENGKLTWLENRTILAGQTAVSSGDDLHRISGVNCRLATLHVYSPPLRNMEIFDPSP